jgi:hypothetical protein
VVGSVLGAVGTGVAGRQSSLSEKGQPLGREGGFTEHGRIPDTLLDKSRQRPPHVQRHQAVNKGFSIIAGG